MEVKKTLRLSWKKACVWLVPLMIPPSSWCQSVFNLFLFRREFDVVFAWIVKKISFSRPDFADSKIAIWGLTSLTGFIKEFTFRSKYVRLSKENLFCSNNAPGIHIFKSWQHQKLLLVANQLKNSTSLSGSNNEDIGISKLVSQLKLLPSLYELKDGLSGRMTWQFLNVLELFSP